MSDFFLDIFCFDKKTLAAWTVLCLWCYVLEAALCALLEKGCHRWGESNLFFPLFNFKFRRELFPEILALLQNLLVHSWHFYIHVLVKNKVVYQWKWSMAPAGLGSAKTSHCRKPLKHGLCCKQRWKTAVMFPDKQRTDADGFVSSFCPLRSLLDFHLLPPVLQLRPAEEFIACIRSEENALCPYSKF